MGASVDSKFQKLLERLQACCAQNFQAAVGGAQRQWMDPPEWNGNPLDIGGMTQPFDRQASNEAYEDELNRTNGRIGVCMARQIEIDYMGMMERAFRARQMSSVRAQAHAAIAQQSHGESKGVHIGVVLQHVQDVLGAGQG